MNEQTIKIAEIHIVTLFRPFSAFFCEEKSCEVPPNAAMPSPLWECINIKAIIKTAAII